MITDEQLEKFVNQVTDNVLKGVEKKAAKYYVERQKHWLHHLWLGWIITFLKFVCWSASIGLVFLMGKGIVFIFKKGLLSIMVPVASMKRVNNGDNHNGHSNNETHA